LTEYYNGGEALEMTTTKNLYDSRKVTLRLQLQQRIKEIQEHLDKCNELLKELDEVPAIEKILNLTRRLGL